MRSRTGYRLTPQAVRYPTLRRLGSSSRIDCLLVAEARRYIVCGGLSLRPAIKSGDRSSQLRCPGIVSTQPSGGTSSKPCVCSYPKAHGHQIFTLLWPLMHFVHRLCQVPCTCLYQTQANSRSVGLSIHSPRRSCYGSCFVSYLSPEVTHQLTHILATYQTLR